MTDYTELKRLAEAAPEGPWFGPEYAPGTSCVFDVDLGTLLEYQSIDSEKDACLRYVAAANPAAVLALIAENDRLKTLRSTTERDLAQELEVWKHGPSCWNCGDTGDVHDMVGEWRGQCDCNAAKLIDVSSERDQLKAEIERQALQFKEWQESHHGNYCKAADERDVLKAENELVRMRIKEMDLLFGRYILAMRSALIEEEHGKGPAAGMEWIYNSLVGPGQLPPEDEVDSQAYFDREIVAVNNGMDEVFAFHDARRKAVQP